MLPKADRVKLVMEWQERFDEESTAEVLCSQRYAEARRAAGLTQEDVAEILGISTYAVQQWELSMCFPSAHNLLRLSKLYGQTVEQLTGY